MLLAIVPVISCALVLRPPAEGWVHCLVLLCDKNLGLRAKRLPTDIGGIQPLVGKRVEGLWHVWRLFSIQIWQIQPKLGAQ